MRKMKRWRQLKEKDAALYRSHFAFPASLSLFLNEEQIEAVKDGMTYGVVKVTYEATLDMIPSLKEEEKAQIYAWLVEAREFAMDAENSNKKHAAFGSTKDVSTIIWPNVGTIWQKNVKSGLNV